MMKRIISLTILTGLALILIACGGNGSNSATETINNTGEESSNEVVSNNVAADDRVTEDTAVSPTNNIESESQTEATTTSLSDDYADALTIQAQLALGTVQLEDTDLAVDEAQATELLPLWQALQSLSQSDTTADLELEAIVSQIQDTMSAEQIAAISAMQLTSDSMSDLAESGQLSFGRGAGNGAGNGFPEGGDFPGGGFPGGGPGGGFGGGPGGVPGGGPGGGLGGANLSEDDLATRQAQFAENGIGQIQDQLLTGMVTRLLEDKLGIVSEGAARANVMNDAMTAVSEATGLTIQDIRDLQFNEGLSLAEIIEANGGDVTAVQAALVELFSGLPNANDLNLEQEAAAWLGLNQ